MCYKLIIKNMNKNNKILISLVVIIIVIILGSLLINNKPASTEPIKFGFIAPLTGDAAIYGTDERNATALAVQEINNAGGVNGRKIEVLYEDGKCNGKDAANSAQKLVNVDQVRVIIGGGCSSETLAAAPVAEANKVILFSPFSSSPAITDAGDYVFRNYPSDSEVVRQQARLVINYGYKKIAIISENSDYAISSKTIFSDEVKKQGAQIVADEIFAQGARDFKTNILKIKSANPDAIFINPQSGVTGGLLLKQLREMGVNTQAFSYFVFGDKDAIKTAGSAINGMIYFDTVGLITAKGQAFNDKYIAQFGQIQSSAYGVGAQYDAVHILANAEAKCSDDTACIKNYLYKMSPYDGVIGKYNFDSNGDIKGISALVPKIVKNGVAELYIK